jgi:hypothetical protein
VASCYLLYYYLLPVLSSVNTCLILLLISICALKVKSHWLAVYLSCTTLVLRSMSFDWVGQGLIYLWKRTEQTRGLALFAFREVYHGYSVWPQGKELRATPLSLEGVLGTHIRSGISGEDELPGTQPGWDNSPLIALDFFSQLSGSLKCQAHTGIATQLLVKNTLDICCHLVKKVKFNLLLKPSKSCVLPKRWLQEI